MANELPVDSLRTSKVLTAIRGPAEGPYTCVFSDGTTDKCDHLVLAIPFTILRDVDIDPRIWNSFRPQKQMAIREMVLGDNGKLHLEFNSHAWKQERMINGHLVKGNGRSYSGPESYISMWQADVHNPSSRGVLCNYTGGYWGRNLTASTPFNIADKKDTNRLLGELEHVWPGLTETYTGKALVTKWVDNPWSKGAFSSPTLGHHTTWWGAQWERESNIHFAGEPCSYEYWGYINGAIESGENVAKVIAQT
ncbi:NAD(P)/FAD-dependent oxidoreductase [Kistimonas scapharcae]|uniref:Tryptophan 2-monooxygenase n=2 Tax=Kistimonas scapharcae TaxID=1036133 RepID=A0ABP8V880_9GAMM